MMNTIKHILAALRVKAFAASAWRNMVHGSRVVGRVARRLKHATGKVFKAIFKLKIKLLKLLVKGFWRGLKLAKHAYLQSLHPWVEKVGGRVYAVGALVFSHLPGPIQKVLAAIYSKLHAVVSKVFDRIKQAVADIAEVIFLAVTTAKEGRLSWYIVAQLAARNLLNSLSRTGLTVGAIASGTAAIVFLVGFAYGLQSIVTNRLIQPNSLRLTDVQSSSTALALNQESLDAIKNTTGVADVSPSMSLAGTLKHGESKTEVIVVGVRNSFLEYSHMQLVAGETFSEEAEAAYVGTSTDLSDLVELSQGEVAGVYTEAEEELEIGDEVTGKKLTFRVADDVYIPVRQTPEVESKVIGYVRGSILNNYTGVEVWGDEYESVSVAGRAYQSSAGEWLGKWLRADLLPLYAEVAPTVYMAQADETGAQIMATGYITQSRISILTYSQVQSDIMIQKLLEEQGVVLGEATVAGETAEDTATTSANTSTAGSVAVVFEASNASASAEAAALQSIVDNDETANATSSVTSAILDIPRSGGKEILVSTGLLKIWELKPEEIVGQTFTLEFIIGGGLVPNINGRVLSNSIEYKVVGVFKDDERPVVYAPLSDVESLGVGKYSLAKVLSDSDRSLPAVREKVEALGFTTRSIADTLNQVERLFRIMRFLLGSFGMIAFIVAIFGMFNTLTVSLLERTREIGVMKTLGTTDGDVVRLMLVESTFIGFVGGILGIFLGMGVGRGVDVLMSFYSADAGVSLFSFPLSFLGFVLLLSVVVGLVTGVYPAKRAKGISALNALRYE